MNPTRQKKENRNEEKGTTPQTELSINQSNQST